MCEQLAAAARRSRVLLLDVEGTTTSLAFVKEKLFPYAEANVKSFLESSWEDAEVQTVVAALRKLAFEDSENKLEGVVAIPAEDAKKEDQIEGLVSNVKWQMSSDRKAGPLKSLQGLIWKQGYDKGDIKGHVYEDVSAALEQWVSEAEHKIYIYSSGSVQAQKLLFGSSSAGDLLPHIAGHFDTAAGAKQEPASYKNIAEKIGCKPDEILFLTDIVNEATAAREAGLNAALVSRSGNTPLPEDVPFPVLHSFSELTATNKRKTDTQEEQPASKVMKISPEEEVKSTSTNNTESKESTVTVEPAAAAAEMEVDPEPANKAEEPKTDQNGEGKTEQTVQDKTETTKDEVVIEEVTESKITADVDIEPVVIEEPILAVDTAEKTVDEPNKPAETKEDVPKEQVKTDDTVVTKESPKPEGEKMDAEESPPAVVTEIEEITDNKSEESDEKIDIDPIIEEPLDSAVLDVVDEDMAELQNVGDVLEKECDEILSKVNEVTNMDDITVKPLLTPVNEESSDQTDSEPTVADESSTSSPTVAEESPNSGPTVAEESSTVESTSTEVLAEPEKMDKKKVDAPTEKVATESESTSTPEETATNGAGEKHLNGTTDAKEAKDKVNGDSKNGEERLSAENGNVESRNGSNGKASEEEEAAKVQEIKVKTVPTTETHTEPVAQATDA